MHYINYSFFLFFYFSSLHKTSLIQFFFAMQHGEKVDEENIEKFSI